MILRIFIFQKVRAGGADIILDCLSHKTKTASVFKGTHSPQGLLYTFFVIPMDIAVKLPYEFFKWNTLPWAAVKHLIFETTKKAFTSWIVRRTTFLGHGASQSCPVHPFYPAGPSVMAPSVRMNDRMFALRQVRNRTIQHGVSQLCIRTASNCPTYYDAVKTVKNRRKVYFATRKGKFGDVCQPLFIWMFCMKVTNNDISYLRTYYFLRFGANTSNDSSCMIRRTTFSEMIIPSFLRAR